MDMENRKKYRLGEAEEIISRMEFEDRCDAFVEADEDMLLLVSGWYVFIPSLSLYLRAGVACVYDKEAEMYLPDFDVTVLYENEIADGKWIYFEQDGLCATLDNWLNGRLSMGEIENLECYPAVPDSE